MNNTFWLEETPATTQRERRKQEFREKIMQAAMELFEQQGCDATTLEDICEIAEVSRPTFYSYYPSKQELIHALAKKLWLNMAKELTSVSLSKHETTQQYVDSFFKMTMTDITRYSRLERELVRQSMASEMGDSNNMDMLKGLTGLFESVYKQGKKRGDIGSQYPADFLAEMTMGCISAVMMRWAVDGEYPVEKRLKQLRGYISNTLELGAKK